MADEHGEGAAWEGPYDPFLMQDDFDDVMYLLYMPAVLDPPPLAAAQAQNVAAAGPSPSGDNNNLLEWPAKSNNDSVGNSAPPHNAGGVATGSPSRAQDVGASTSATASTSSPAATHQNAFDCTGCQLLREVLHSNGFEARKLSIHGAAGVFHHATLEVYRINSDGMATALTRQSYIDFSGRNYVWVKHYLTNYAQQRACGGYTVIHDSTSAFHDALCTGMNCGGNAEGDNDREGEIMAAAVENGGGGSGNQQQDGNQQQEFAGAVAPAAQPITEQGDDAPAAAAGPSETSANNEQEQEVRQVGRSALAIQRERASNLQLSDLARYFHLPMTEAAKHLGVCATVLKTTSRRFHVPRWPHRKIKSIDNHIAKLRRSGGDGGGAAVMREMERLTESRREIYADLLGQ